MVHMSSSHVSSSLWFCRCVSRQRIGVFRGSSFLHKLPASHLMMTPKSSGVESDPSSARGCSYPWDVNREPSQKYCTAAAPSQLPLEACCYQLQSQMDKQSADRGKRARSSPSWCNICREISETAVLRHAKASAARFYFLSSLFNSSLPPQTKIAVGDFS